MSLSAKTARYTFTVPTTDTQIVEWAALQHSLSVSMRLIIKDYIAKHGMVDASCQPMMMTDDVPVVTVPHINVEAVDEQPVEDPIPETKSESETIEENIVKNSPADDILADLMK